MRRSRVAPKRRPGRGQGVDSVLFSPAGVVTLPAIFVLDPKGRMMSSYNGWSNWETWNVNLWMMNEEPSYRAIVRAGRNGGFSAESAKRLFLEWYPSGMTPDFNGSREARSVDWEEIAAAWSEVAQS